MDTSSKQNTEDTNKKGTWGSFVYNAFQNVKDPLLSRQLFFINTFSIIGFLAAFGFGLLNIFEKNYQVGIPDLLTGVAFLLNLILFRLTQNILLAKAIMLSTLGALLIVILATGGTENTGIYWFFAFPIAAFFLMGREKGIIWSLFLYCATAIVSLLGTLGYVSLAYSLVEIRQLFISLFVVCILVYLYQNAIEESEKQVEQEKVKDEALLVSIGEGMIAVDITGKILVINKTAKELLRLNDREVLGKPYTDIVIVQDKNGKPLLESERPIVKALAHGDASKGECLFIRHDGSSFPVIIVATPVILNSKIIGAIGLFRDITEEKDLDRAKSEFVALASHQLRTPISAISWFTEMLINGDSGPLNKEQKEHLTKVYQSNERMGELVTSLLYVSQLDLRNMLVKPELVDLAKMSHAELAEELKKHQMSKKLIIEEQYDERLTHIPLDPEIMKIIFQNLFANAIKYTPDNGKIRVEIAVVEPDVSKNNLIKGVLIRVKDTGIGIPKQQMSKIFMKLFRADNAKSIDTDGTGLGLYIVKEIMDEVGGKIWFESEENKGSTFSVWLSYEGMKEIKK